MRINKKFIIFTLLVLLGFAVLVYLTRGSLKTPGNQVITEGSTPFPLPNLGSGKNIPTDPQIVSNGVSIKNVYKDSVKVTPENDAVISNETGYQIIYMSQFDQFLISVLNPDFNTGRAAAEAKLLTQTGTTKESACKLNVVISTPSFVNTELEGQSFGLSFCSK